MEEKGRMMRQFRQRSSSFVHSVSSYSQETDAALSIGDECFSKEFEDVSVSTSFFGNDEDHRTRRSIERVESPRMQFQISRASSFRRRSWAGEINPERTVSTEPGQAVTSRPLPPLKVPRPKKLDLHSVFDRCGGDLELLNSVLESFFEQGSLHLHGLNDAVIDEDLDNLFLHVEFLRGSCQNVCAFRMLVAVERLWQLLARQRGCSLLSRSESIVRLPSTSSTSASETDEAGVRRYNGRLHRAAEKVRFEFVSAMEYWRAQIEPQKSRVSHQHDSPADCSNSDSDDAATDLRCLLMLSNHSDENCAAAHAHCEPAEPHNAAVADTAYSAYWRPLSPDQSGRNGPIGWGPSQRSRPSSPMRGLSAPLSPAAACPAVVKLALPALATCDADDGLNEGDSEVEEVDSDARDMVAFFQAAHAQLAAARASHQRRHAAATAAAAGAIRLLAQTAGSRSVCAKAADIEQRAAAAACGGRGGTGLEAGDLDALEQQIDAAEAIWRSCNLRV